jgi:hypothetical protein
MLITGGVLLAGCTPRVVRVQAPAAEEPLVVNLAEPVTDAMWARYVGKVVVVRGYPSWIPNAPYAWVEGARGGGTGEVFVTGMSRWPEALGNERQDYRVEVRGTLAKRKLEADPQVSSDGKIVSNGMFGDQYTLDNARWKVMDEGVKLAPKVYEGQGPQFRYHPVDFEPMVGHEVTVEGSGGEDAVFGAFVDPETYSENCRIFLSGLATWPEGMATGRIRVTGTLAEIRDVPRPGLGKDGKVEMAAWYDTRFLLEGARYEVVREKQRHE